MNNKPYIIGIAGESGVGKSSISEIVSLFYGPENVLIISTDDLHKWDRYNPKWKEMTHLNPEANNLDLGDYHLDQLLSGKSIYRSIYNHKTGYFDSPTKIAPKKVIIIEGLHAFYTEFSQNNIDLKIFVDTDEDLRIHWKIVRDTEERGYTYNNALEAINKRKNDAQIIRDRQLGIADIILNLKPQKKIKHVGDKHEKTSLETEFISHKNQELTSFVKDHINELDNFLLLCDRFSDINYVQNGGGNISVKIGKYSIIKSSGVALKDITASSGYSVIEHDKFQAENELEYNKQLESCNILSHHLRPSMETGFHTLLKKYVIHLHPIYLTFILCLKESKNIVAELFKEISHEYLEYFNPGIELFQIMKQKDKNNNVFFLGNHGVIIHSESLNEIGQLTEFVCQIASDYVINNYQPFNLNFEANSAAVSFPDAAVFGNNKKEILALKNYINAVGGDNIRYLTENQIHEIKNLETERYRLLK